MPKSKKSSEAQEGQKLSEGILSLAKEKVKAHLEALLTKLKARSSKEHG
jgi:hypothetical protein